MEEVLSRKRNAFSSLLDKPDQHRLFTDHVTSEYRVKTEGRGRTVDEWKLRPERGDNHWFDGLVGCAVAASIQVCHIAGHGRKVRGSSKAGELCDHAMEPPSVSENISQRNDRGICCPRCGVPPLLYDAHRAPERRPDSSPQGMP
jgi:hypothetical protein